LFFSFSTMESRQHYETQVQNTAIEQLRCDIRSLLRNASLVQARELCAQHLTRHGFSLVSCEDERALEEHIVAIFQEAGRRQGKIRAAVSCAIHQVRG